MNKTANQVEVLIDSNGFIVLEIDGLKINIGSDEEVKRNLLKETIRLLGKYYIRDIEMSPYFRNVLFRCASHSKVGGAMREHLTDSLACAREWVLERNIRARLESKHPDFFLHMECREHLSDMEYLTPEEFCDEQNIPRYDFGKLVRDGKLKVKTGRARGTSRLRTLVRRKDAYDYMQRKEHEKKGQRTFGALRLVADGVNLQGGEEGK